MVDDTTRNQRHKERMQRVKQKVDEKIARAQDERGLLLVLTGNGKGKSTAGFGTITRAVGHGLSAAVVQFIKGDWACGERDLLSAAGVPFHVMGTGFTWETQDREKDKAATEEVWQQAEALLADPEIDMILLDEITYMISYKYLDADKLYQALANRPAHQHVIITGRGAPRELVEMADTVSEVKPIKHAFEEGVKAQKGLDW